MFIVHCSHGATLIFDDLFIIVLQVDTLCDRLAILVAGRVNAEGSPDQLKQHFGGGYKVSMKLLIVDR